MRTAVLILGLLLAGAALPQGGLAQAPTDSAYTVQSGDTLYSIAQRFGVSVEELQRWNGLEGTGLQIGQALLVRPPRATPPPNDTSSTDPSSADTTASTDTSAAADPLAVGDTTATADTATADTVTTDTATVDSSATAPSTAADVTGPTGPPPRYGRHTAAMGDSFVGLALRLGTTADTLVLGSNYDNNFDDLTPDPEATNYIQEKTARMVPDIAEAEVQEVQAGVRVKHTDTNTPLLGPLPRRERIWTFTALGSKGLLTAPLLAHDLPTFFDDPERIPNPVSLFDS